MESNAKTKSTCATAIMVPSITYLHHPVAHNRQRKRQQQWLDVVLLIHLVNSAFPWSTKMGEQSRKGVILAHALLCNKYGDIISRSVWLTPLSGVSRRLLTMPFNGNQIVKIHKLKMRRRHTINVLNKRKFPQW